MNDKELWAFDLKFWIAVVLLVIAFCGNARAQVKPIVMVWEDCDGKVQWAQVHITWSYAPTITCAEQIGRHDVLQGIRAVLEVAVACSYRIGDDRFIVLPYNAPAALITHEVGHTTDAMHHPPMLPIAETWCSPKRTEALGASSVTYPP